MKPVAKRTRPKNAFTIVELLTVMSIIVILIGLMVPALNQVKIYATNVKQKAQFKSIEAALGCSTAGLGAIRTRATRPGAHRARAYCALKPCEAMMGQDLGYHPTRSFAATARTVWVGSCTQATLALGRRAPALENSNAYPLGELYKPSSFVLRFRIVRCAPTA
jgi:hypothetical protein